MICVISIFKNSVSTSVVLIDFVVRCRKLSLEEITNSISFPSFSALNIFLYFHLTVSDIVSRVQFSRCSLSETLRNTSRHSHYFLRTFRFTQDHIGVTFCIPTTRTVDVSDTKIIGLSLTGMELIGFGLVTADSSVKCCSCPLFDMDLEFLDKSETK